MYKATNMKTIVCKLLNIASDLDKNGYHKESDEVTAAAQGMIPDYGKMALDKLFGIYGPEYEYYQYMADHHVKMQTKAIDRFLNDIRNFEPNIFDWLNNNPDIFKLILRWLKRLGADVPDYFSHDCDYYKLEDTLKDPKYMEGVIKMFQSQNQQHLYEIIPEEYVTNSKIDALEERKHKS